MNDRNDSGRRTGFTIPGGAAAAARKNHDLGTAHRFTSTSARDAGLKSADRRRAQEAYSGPNRRVG